MEEKLRNYLGNANNKVDIFEFIKKAITVAATDHPTEFRNDKDKIFETLYSCDKTSSTGNEISSTENTQEDTMLNNKLQEKESVPKASKTACDQPKAKGPTTIRSVYRQGVAEVSRIKGILDDKAGGESESVVICDLLAKLKYMGLTVNTLEVTGIGKTVKVLRKHASKEVSQIAGRLLKEWRDMVEECLKNDASNVVHPDKAENMTKGQVKDMFSKEVVIQDKTKTVEPPMMEKENRTISQRANSRTVDVVKKVLPVSKPVILVAKSTQSGINSQSLKNTKGLMIPHQQSKPTDSSSRMPKRIESSLEEKLEATKRKLHQRYEDVENMKKKRRIQVLAFHELPKKGVLSKQSQHIKRQGHQLRRSCGNAHRRIGQLVRTY